jgi:hypothetical protein
MGSRVAASGHLHIERPHAHRVGLSPFPKESNRHVDHDYYYYDLNQKPNRHFAASLTPPNCPTDPSSGQQAGCEKKTESCWCKVILHQQLSRKRPPLRRASLSVSAPQFQNKRLSSLLRRKMPQLARLWVEPGIPEIKRRLLARKRAAEIRLSLRGYKPRAGALIERDGACCFPCFVGQVRYLRGHSRPPLRKPNGGLLVPRNANTVSLPDSFTIPSTVKWSPSFALVFGELQSQ